MKAKPVSMIKIIIAAVILVITAGMSISLLYSLRNTSDMVSRMALENTRALFTEIIATRQWNAEHGGVYLVVKDDVRPNPYLKDPYKNITSNYVVKLTKVNPAFMTRMISEVMVSSHSIHFHITSLMPINPGNAADAWERESLALFEKGIEETSALVPGGKEIFRYMAPLKTEKACLVCHAEQGYREGEVLGGISVTIPFANYREMIRRTHTSAYLRNTVIWFFSVSVILLLGSLLVGNVRRGLAARSEANTLRGFLPICSSCKKIRNDAGYWERLEKYIEEHSEAQMSHGLCPGCSDRLYGDQEWYIKGKEKAGKDRA